MTFRTWLRTSTTRFADRKPRRTRRGKFAIELLEDRRLLSGWTLALPGDASTPFNRTPDAWDSKVDVSGNVYVTGNFYGTINFDPKHPSSPTNLTNVGDSDAFLAKYTPAGDLAWVTGDFSGTTSFGPTTLTSAGQNDVFVTKLDPAGGFLWVKGVGGASSDRVFQVAAVSTDSGDVVYLQANLEGGTADFDPGIGVTNVSGISAVAKYTSDGALVWASGFAGAINGFDFDTSGNIYTTGRFWGTVDFDLGLGVFNRTSAGIADRPYSDAYLSKWNSSGNLTWVRRMGGSDFDVTHSVAVDAAGNVHVTGKYNDRGGIGDFGVSGSADFPTGDTLT